MRTFSKLVAAATVTIALVSSAGAEGYPVEQITITVPFPPGGTTDILARELGPRLAEELSVNVLIDNRPGAGATIGSNHVARGATDGSQLLISPTHHAINPALRDDLPYDTLEDFQELALVAMVPNALVVHPDVPATNVLELIEWINASAEPVLFGSAGVGSGNHLSGELFKSMANLNMVHVPYPGAAPAMTDLLGGHIPIMFDSLPTVVPHAEAGGLRLLAVTLAERDPSLPEVPTIAEAGNLPGYEAVAWFGLHGPAGISQDARLAIEDAMRKILASESLKEAFDKINVYPGTLVGAEFEQFVKDEMEKWSAVIEAEGITLE